MRLLTLFLFTLSFIACNTLLAQMNKIIDVREQVFTTASGLEIEATTGALIVSENRSVSSAATIEIPYVHLKSTAKKPGTPVVYLEGGPGSSCTWMAENPHALEGWAHILKERDVILFDQRGTGAASDRMTWIRMYPLSENMLVDEAGATKHFLDMVPFACKHWAEQDIDLRGYTSLESATDLDELRAALGFPKISLLGFSYGSHLGQVYLKFFGDQVDRAILAGIEGLDETFKLPLAMDAQFRKVAQMVAQDPNTKADVPDLVALYQRVSKKLSDEPITLTLRSPLTGEDMDVKVGKFGLDFILFRDIGDASDLPIFPRLLYTIDQGDYSIFTWFVQKRISAGYGLHGMSITMDIASGASAGRQQLIDEQATQSLFGNVVNTPYRAMAAAWPVPALDNAFRADFSTNHHILLLSGSLDFNTPPYQAERLRWSMPNARHIVVQNAGHEQILSNPQVGEAIVNFLAGKDISDVTAANPPLRFMPVKGAVEDISHPALN